MHEFSKKTWHLVVAEAAKLIMNGVPVNIQLQTAHQKLNAQNKINTTEILKTISLHEEILKD